MTRIRDSRITLQQCRSWCLMVGVISLLLTAVGLFFSRDQFFRSYLWAFLFWFSIALGCLPLLMLYHLVGGGWGFTIRRILESGTRTIPLMAVLFIPVVLGMHRLYIWSQPNSVQPLLVREKQFYLNTAFWI